MNQKDRIRPKAVRPRVRMSPSLALLQRGTMSFVRNVAERKRNTSARISVENGTVNFGFGGEGPAPPKLGQKSLGIGMGQHFGFLRFYATFRKNSILDETTRWIFMKFFMKVYESSNSLCQQNGIEIGVINKMAGVQSFTKLISLCMHEGVTLCDIVYLKIFAKGEIIFSKKYFQKICIQT